MQPALLPLFPLPAVVFPRTPVPLHIFEERYKEMIGEVIHNQGEFGVVLAKDNGIVNAGCTAKVDKVVKRYDDGRMDIIATGVRRFEILSIDTERSFLRGEIEYFDDDEEDAGPAASELQSRALEEYRRLLEIGVPIPYGDPKLTDPQLSFQLAFGLPDLDFLHRLLRDRSETSRLKQVTSYLVHYIPKLQETGRMKKLAPLNGHSHRSPSL